MGVDEILMHPDPYNMDLNEKNRLKLKAIKESFVYHYNNCEKYRIFCKSRDFSPDKLKGFSDLSKIPLLPIGVFKKYDLLSVDKQDISIIAKSSGTTGSVSRVYRDKITIDRLTKGVFKMVDWMTEGRKGFVGALVPPPGENDAWIIQSSSMIFPKYFDRVEHFIRGGRIDINYMMKILSDPDLPKPRHLFGPPFAYLMLAEALQKNSITIKLDEGSLIVTGGGWKSFEDKSIPKDTFRGIVSRLFSIPVQNIRDSLSCAEINSWITDCRCFKKHVPPWLHVSIRDPENPDEEVGVGEEGLIAYLDPLAHSYPGFILTDDVGKIIVEENEVCECGSIGPCLHENVRRAKGAEARGCALRLQELIRETK